MADELNLINVYLYAQFTSLIYFNRCKPFNIWSHNSSAHNTTWLDIFDVAFNMFKTFYSLI